MKKLKKLKLITRLHETPTRAAYTGALDYNPLLPFLSKLKTLKVLRFDDFNAAKGAADGGEQRVPWPVAFKKYPDLATKLVEITVVDSDVPAWASLNLTKVKEVRLVDIRDRVFEDFTSWKQTDAFAGLTKLSINGVHTKVFVDFPFRSLKELHVDDCYLSLDEWEFEQIRAAVEAQNLTVTLAPWFSYCTSKDEAMMWRKEITFWRGLGATVAEDEDGTLDMFK